ncbi:MAG: hypothetical protein M0Z95_14725 [Actinomycetota bacterium]|nr:hypothetical protein [Actinomycetota bacterium]
MTLSGSAPHTGKGTPPTLRGGGSKVPPALPRMSGGDPAHTPGRDLSRNVVQGTTIKVGGEARLGLTQEQLPTFGQPVTWD